MQVNINRPMDGIDMFLELDGDSSIEKHGWPINWMILTKSRHGKMGWKSPKKSIHPFKTGGLSRWGSHLLGVFQRSFVQVQMEKNTQHQC